MSAIGANILNTIENISKSIVPGKVNKKGVEKIVDKLLDTIVKSNLSFAEADSLINELIVLVLTARSSGILTFAETEEMQSNLLKYKTMYSLEPTQTDYIFRFIKSYMHMKTLSTADEERNKFIPRDFFFRARSLDMLPALNLCIDIIKDFKSADCKDVIEHRIGLINFNNDINRDDANYSDYLRLLTIAFTMGWCDKSNVEIYKLRCREMSKQYTDENGIPVGFEGNSISNTLTEVETVEKDYLPKSDLTDNFN